MIARRLPAVVRDRLRTASAVVLLGPRQVGKTTLARRIASARGPKLGGGTARAYEGREALVPCYISVTR